MSRIERDLLEHRATAGQKYAVQRLGALQQPGRRPEKPLTSAVGARQTDPAGRACGGPAQCRWKGPGDVVRAGNPIDRALPGVGADDRQNPRRRCRCRRRQKTINSPFARKRRVQGSPRTAIERPGYVSAPNLPAAQMPIEVDFQSRKAPGIDAADNDRNAPRGARRRVEIDRRRDDARAYKVQGTLQHSLSRARLIRRGAPRLGKTASGILPMPGPSLRNRFLELQIRLGLVGRWILPPGCEGCPGRLHRAQELGQPCTPIDPRTTDACVRGSVCGSRRAGRCSAPARNPTYDGLGIARNQVVEPSCQHCVLWRRASVPGQSGPTSPDESSVVMPPENPTRVEQQIGAQTLRSIDRC